MQIYPGVPYQRGSAQYEQLRKQSGRRGQQPQGGLKGAWGNIAAHQNQSRSRMLDAIEKLRAQLQGGPVGQPGGGGVSRGLMQRVRGNLQNPAGDFRKARTSMLAENLAGLTRGAQQRQEGIENQLAGAGLSRSGLMGKQLMDLERQRLGAESGLRRGAAQDIALHQDQAEQQAIAQGMQYQGLQSGIGQGILGQLQRVLGGTTYTPPPDIPSTRPEQNYLDALREQIARTSAPQRPTDTRTPWEKAGTADHHRDVQEYYNEHGYRPTESQLREWRRRRQADANLPSDVSAMLVY